MEIFTWHENNVYHIRFSGRFTFSDNPEFRVILEKIHDPDIHTIVLQMERLEFVDSAALGMLLLAHDESKKNHKTLRVQGVQGQVKRMFEMAHFEQFFTLQ